MKATKLLLVTALFAGLATLSFAGPGPDYRTRMNQAEKDHAQAQAAAASTVQAGTPAVACGSCGCGSVSAAKKS